MIAGFLDSFPRDRKHIYGWAVESEINWVPEHYFDAHRDQFQAVVHAGETSAT